MVPAPAAAAVLEGQPLNGSGTRTPNVMRWSMVGVKVVRGHAGRVSAENRTRLRQLDLHFHDRRHEAGSRKLEAGWPLHAVSRWLGHTKLTTTDTYLNATTRLLHELNERVPLTLVR